MSGGQISPVYEALSSSWVIFGMSVHIILAPRAGTCGHGSCSTEGSLRQSRVQGCSWFLPRDGAHSSPVHRTVLRLAALSPLRWTRSCSLSELVSSSSTMTGWSVVTREGVVSSSWPRPVSAPLWWWWSCWPGHLTSPLPPPSVISVSTN